MEKKVITHEVAQSEVNGWLDKKKVYESTREAYKDQIDILVEGIQRGDLAINDKSEFVHTLLFPDTTSGDVKVITYKSRITDQMLRPHKQGLKLTDSEGLWLAYAACLSGQPKNIMSALDSADKKLANAIITFFF